MLRYFFQMEEVLYVPGAISANIKGQTYVEYK